MNCILRHAVWTLPLLLSAPHFAGSPLRATQDEEPLAEEPRWTQEKLEAVTLEIQAQIEEMRGAKFTKPVEVAFIDQAGLIEYMQERMAAISTPEELHASELIFKMLGLIEPSANMIEESMAMLEGQVAGLYSPERKTFYLMDWVTSEGIAKMTLAHELTHALDDQLYDLDAPILSTVMTTDAHLAYHSVVEGSGMAAMARWMQENPSEFNIADALEMQGQSADLLDGVPEAVWKPAVMPYMHGEAFLRRESAMLNVFGKLVANDDVASAFASPPRSTEQILHPGKYWEEEARDLPVELSFQIGELPQGWKASYQDTLGEVVLSLVTTPVSDRNGVDMGDPVGALAVKFSNDAAAGWGGDRFVLLESENAAILRGVTAWDTREDAEEFVRALQACELEIEKNLFGLGEFFEAPVEATSQFRIERKSETVVQITASAGVKEASLGAVLDVVVSNVP